MAVTVVVRSAASEPPKLTFDSPRVVIGRSDSCEVRLPDPSVSHRHASIRQRGADYLVQDEGSTNGTFVGPVRLPVGAPRVLRTGDKVRVGRIWLEVRIDPAAIAQSQSQATRELALRLVAEGLASQGEPAALRVEVLEGPAKGQTLELIEADRPYVVGSGKRADLRLDDPDLSRQHVQIVRKGGRLVVRDLGTEGGSRLDDAPVASDKDTRWTKGQVLRIGQHALGFEDPVGEALAELERMPDEKLSAEEPFDDPDAAPEPAPERDARPPEPAPRPAPASDRPPRPGGLRRRQATVGWTATDYLVALAALALLTLSVIGILWLLGMG